MGGRAQVLQGLSLTLELLVREYSRDNPAAACPSCLLQSLTPHLAKLRKDGC